MKKTFLSFGVALLGIGFLTGCYNDPLDPTQIGRFEPTPAVNVILDTLGVADEPSPVYEGSEPPRPEDLVDYESDYVFGSGDMVRISIFELYQEGQTYVNDYIVTETGRISIPDVGLVRAAGLTEPELEQEIHNILSPTILKNPSVTATLLQSQSRIFSIVGQGVGQSARFSIPRYTFRLTDAIALAGGVSEFNVTYIYVSREVSGQLMQTSQTPSAAPVTESITTPQTIELTPVEPAEPTVTPEEEMLEIIAPAVVSQPAEHSIASVDQSTRHQLEALAAPASVQTTPLRRMADAPIDWVLEDGKWRPKSADGAAAEPLNVTAPAKPQAAQPESYGLADVGQAGKITRVIKIPVDKLLSGNPDYNIIIRPGDRITVPVDLIGEFWVMGNVNAQGAVTITGRPITLKQAIATAGGLGALAWPQKVEVVRRIGRNAAGLMQEETVLVDLQKIARGQQPDFFIKPNDLINVGTNGTARWQAVLRNAFRATYGFGFIYDRNFADRHFNDSFSNTFHL